MSKENPKKEVILAAGFIAILAVGAVFCVLAVLMAGN